MFGKNNLFGVTARAFSLVPESACLLYRNHWSFRMKKTLLTFESYDEMRDHFRDLVYSEKVKAVLITGVGKNFCSGRDVSEIIGPLTKMSMKGITCYYQNNWIFS